jgi:hypothetical protein
MRRGGSADTKASRDRPMPPLLRASGGGTPMKIVSTWLAILALLATGGCASSLADPTGKHNALEWAQREYTQRVRWGDVTKASEYIEENRREEFVASGETFEDIRITDYEIGSINYTDENDDNAEVTVTYRAYSISTLIETSVKEQQKWNRTDGLENNWWVYSELPEKLARLAPRAR